MAYSRSGEGQDLVSAGPSTVAAMKDPDGITLARLNGTAHRVLRERLDQAAAVEALQALSTDPRTLGWAAGIALGAYRAERSHDSDRVAQLLLDAGGNPAVAEERAAAVVRRLQVDRGRPGIGMPS